MQLVIRSNFKRLLEVYVAYLAMLLHLLGLRFRVVGLPIKRKVFTLLKSPHVNKKAKDQFEIKTYKKIISFPKDIPAMHLRNILKNKPPVVQIRILATKGK